MIDSKVVQHGNSEIYDGIHVLGCQNWHDLHLCAPLFIWMTFSCWQISFHLDFEHMVVILVLRFWTKPCGLVYFNLAASQSKHTVRITLFVFYYLFVHYQRSCTSITLIRSRTWNHCVFFSLFHITIASHTVNPPRCDFQWLSSPFVIFFLWLARNVLTACTCYPSFNSTCKWSKSYDTPLTKTARLLSGLT